MLSFLRVEGAKLRRGSTSILLALSGILDVFSAKGATFIFSLGQRPRKFVQDKTTSAESCDSFRHVESRLQRSLIQPRSWGDAPGCYDIAPLALNTSGILPDGSAIWLSFPGKRQKLFADDLSVFHRVNADFR